MFTKAIQWLAPWWASLIDKKIYVAVTFGSTVLLAVSIGWHAWDNFNWMQQRKELRTENQELRAENTRIVKGNELINIERINELKADRDTAFARLDRLTRLIKNQ